MVHTSKDYSNKYRQPTLYGNIDNAELAARLFSINTYVRSGSIVWMDDFEDNLNKWGHGAGGVGASIVLSDSAARNGKYSCKLTTANVDGSTARLNRAMGLLNESKIGFEVSYADMDDAAFLTISLAYYTGTAVYQGVLRIAENSGHLYCWDQATAAYILLDTLTLRSETYIWHTMKLVIDMTTGMNVIAMFNNMFYDISAYSLLTAANATGPSIQVYVELETDADANKICYVDDAIITQNEPY